MKEPLKQDYLRIGSMETFAGTRQVHHLIRTAGVAAALALIVAPLSGQTRRVQATIGVQAATFPHYVSSDDAYTRPFGGTIGVRVWAPTAPIGVEFAVTHAPQGTTDRSAAPTLTIVRAGLLLGVPPSPARRVTLHGVIQPSILVVDAQVIDCGTFPVCAEWSPSDLTTVGLTFGAGAELQLNRRLVLLVDGLGLVAITGWDPLGRKSLVELAVGLGLRL